MGMNQTTTPPISSRSISVDGLTKTWTGSVEAVKGISFGVAPGEVFGLLGPNGAGKSTTIGMLTTTVLPTGGHAQLHGYDVVTQPKAARAVSAVVFQDPVVDKALTGRRNLEIHARLWGVPRETAARRIEQQLDDFELAEIIDRPVATFSGGQRRRLEIARALLSDPQVLFLDEPTVGLDARIRHELLDLIAALRTRTGTTVLLTTHYLDEAERLCDRVGIMHAGTIVALDTPARLLADLGDQVIELHVAGDSVAALERLQSDGTAGTDAFTVGTTITIPVRGRAASEVVSAVARTNLVTTAISTRLPTLDDVYLRLTGDRIAA
jgi:ABC-2 type transport system ATP-binding protein